MWGKEREMSREELEGEGRGTDDVNTVLVYEVCKNLIKNHFVL